VSGVHLRWLTLAKHFGVPIRNYLAEDHAVQIEMRQMLNRLARHDAGVGVVRAQNNNLPAVSMPLHIAAALMARIADSANLPLDLAPASRRVMAAVAAQPEFSAGPRRFNSVLAIETHGDVLSFGSNGCYGALIRRKNMGAVVRIDDGDDDAAKLVLLNNLHEIGAIDVKTQRSVATATIATPG
jgi:L-asparaginase II